MVYSATEKLAYYTHGIDFCVGCREGSPAPTHQGNAGEGEGGSRQEDRTVTTVIGYTRVSTEEQASSGLGLKAQRETITRYAEAHGWDVVWYEDAGLNAKSLDRPQLQAALARLHVPPKRRDVDGIVVAKLDRLSRSVLDFAGVLELARGRKWAMMAIDLGVDTSTPTGELVANVMMSVA